MESEIKELRESIKKVAIPTTDSLNTDSKSIMYNVDTSKVSSFMQFFWSEQQKYIQASSTGVRYHPTIIRHFKQNHPPLTMICVMILKLALVS